MQVTLTWFDDLALFSGVRFTGHSRGRSGPVASVLPVSTQIVLSVIIAR